MSLNPHRKFWRTIGFRLTFWYFTLFILSSAFLFVLTYFLLSSRLRTQDHQTIEIKLNELKAVYKMDGFEALKREVDVDKKFGKSNPYFIRIAGPQGKTLFLILPYQWVKFHLKSLENIKPGEGTTWTYLPLEDHGNELEIASISLSGDFFLQVGKSNEERNRVLQHFRQIFMFITAPLVLLGFAGGALVAFRALRPVRSLIQIVRAIDLGEMNAHVPRSYTGDELDELVTLFNRMLRRIASLIKGMKDSLENVAHDLRTPLTRLRTTAEMALQDKPTAASLKEALSDCLEESELILRMLNTLMDISEAETGTINLERKSVSVSSLINQVVDIYAYIAEEKNIRVQTQFPEDLHFSVDPNRIRQVLANLLDNAIKFTPDGGSVELEAEKRDNRVLFTINDTGCGIHHDDLPHIWDRLYRSDRSRSEKGLGLGLSLVKAIVMAHEGSVDVTSEPGKGSKFVISLPAEK